MTISVVMATHNGALFLGEQLASIVNGDRRPDEIVIVDDASTDDTWSILTAWRSEQLIHRITLLRNPTNLGPTASFFQALKNSTGEVVLFSDQDDQWLPGKVTTLSDRFSQDPQILMAYSDGTITDEALRPVGRTIFSTRNKAQLILGAARDPMEIMANPDIKGCTMALRGDFARQVATDTAPGLALLWGHDHWLALFAFGMGHVAVIPEPLLLHRFHASNTSSATRFNPLSRKHLKKQLATVRAQRHDHWHQRYAIVKEQVERCGYAVNDPWRQALDRWIEIGKERSALHGRSLLQRLPKILALHRRGIYGTYYNGPYTMLRDLFL